MLTPGGSLAQGGMHLGDDASRLAHELNLAQLGSSKIGSAVSLFPEAAATVAGSSSQQALHSRRQESL